MWFWEDILLFLIFFDIFKRDIYVIVFEINILDIVIMVREWYNILFYYRNKLIDEGVCCNL